MRPPTLMAAMVVLCLTTTAFPLLPSLEETVNRVARDRRFVYPKLSFIDADDAKAAKDRRAPIFVYNPLAYIEAENNDDANAPHSG